IANCEDLTLQNKITIPLIYFFYNFGLLFRNHVRPADPDGYFMTTLNYLPANTIPFVLGLPLLHSGQRVLHIVARRCEAERVGFGKVTVHVLSMNQLFKTGILDSPFPHNTMRNSTSFQTIIRRNSIDQSFSRNA